jgi:hypothetical protein
MRIDKNDLTRKAGPPATYNVCLGNCAHFTIAGLFHGHALNSDQVDSIGAPQPNSIFEQLAAFETTQFEMKDLVPLKGCVTVEGSDLQLHTKCN